MKIFLLIFLLLPTIAVSQIVDTCLTKTQIINITAELQNNELEINNLNYLNTELELQLINYKNLREQDKIIIDNLSMQNSILAESLQKSITKPKWYQTKEFYFGIGVVTVFTCAQILNLISR